MDKVWVIYKEENMDYDSIYDNKVYLDKGEAEENATYLNKRDRGLCSYRVDSLDVVGKDGE